jgi:outer membrane protein insertion porin family
MRARTGDRRRALPGQPRGPWVTGLLFLAIVLLSAVAAAQTVVPIRPTPPRPPPPQVRTPDAPADLSGLTGKSIVRVSVAIEGNVWPDVEPPAIHDVKVGDTLTPAVARRAMAELLSSGRFADASATATKEGEGVALLLRVAPRKRVGHIELDLHGARVNRDELLRDANLADDGEIVGTELGEIRAAIARHLALHGYPAAKVDLQTRTMDDPSRTRVVVDVAPGNPRLVDDRELYVFGASPDEVMPVARAFALGPKDRADEPALDEAEASLEQALRGKGWPRADVSYDLVRVEQPGRSDRVVLRVRIDTGPRVVPRFEGNDHYDTETLTAALSLETETDRSPTHLAEKLRVFYQKRGFLDVDVRTELRGEDSAPVQLLVFHVEERVRVTVSARQYPCLKVDAIARLSNGGPRSPGDIGTEIDSFLEEELPGADLFVDPNARGVAATISMGAGQVATGARPSPTELRPESTYLADTYERAAEHVRELYRNEGFLHAEVGPVQVLRARCDPRSPPNRCVPLPLLPLASVCGYGPTGLPLPPRPVDAAMTCRPDAARGVECAPSVEVVIPVELGPRTRLWDVAFTGVGSHAERDIAAAADLPLGDPVSTTKLDAARRRIVDWYKELGYAYVDVKYAIEPSLDNTRARLRFDVIEGPQVMVRAIVIRGLVHTRESTVRRRVVLEVGEPFRTSRADRTRENIDTLGVFSSVAVSLSDPYIPQEGKTVYIDVVERLPRYVEVRPGFSTGEGVRGTLEYDERNVLGYAIGGVFRAQLSYLPDFLILDPQVKTNYQSVQDRVARRITLGGTFPEVGLGSQVRAQLDAIYVRDLERDFTLDKESGFAGLIYRPIRSVTVAVGQSIEDNDVRLFQFNSLAAYIACNAGASGFNSGLAALLRIPDGTSFVVAQRASVAWDRRDSAFNAHRGTFVLLGGELVNSFPEGAPVQANVNLATLQSTCPNIDVTALAPAPQAYSHFVRLTQTFAGYIPLVGGTSLALELRLGENVRVAPCNYVNSAPDQQNPAYCTYPDRLFFMGGFDSMRGWLQDTFMPQDYADEIHANPSLCVKSSTDCLIPIRGGNLMINPRAELRFPLYGAIDAALFADFGNLWVDPGYAFNHPFVMRADVGPGVRLQTPVGPLVFDYGINVTRRIYEDFGAFHFAIGLF